MIKILKTFKVDNQGKTKAFFFNKNQPLKINKKHLNFLESFYKKYSEEVRICLHEDYNEELQTMINLIHQKKSYIVHKHKFSSEYYQVLRGKLKLIVFDAKFKIIRTLILPKDSIIGKVKRGQYHIAVPVTKTCIYLEFRSGNFSKHKNIFTKKVISLQSALKK